MHPRDRNQTSVAPSASKRSYIPTLRSPGLVDFQNPMFNPRLSGRVTETLSEHFCGFAFRYRCFEIIASGSLRCKVADLTSGPRHQRFVLGLIVGEGGNDLATNGANDDIPEVIRRRFRSDQMVAINPYDVRRNRFGHPRFLANPILNYLILIDVSTKRLEHIPRSMVVTVLGVSNAAGISRSDTNEQQV